MTDTDTSTPPETGRPDPPLHLEQHFRSRFPELCTDVRPDVPPHPEAVVFNTALADELGAEIRALGSPAGTEMLSGAQIPTGAEPIAMAYAGHQFGGYSPLLGDGRATLLGEIRRPDGALLDLHLKGTGRTVYARGGDGKAVLGPMLREYLVAESMHALGVPTNRALSVVTTGESIAREGGAPGAVLARLASSHLRVGTFELAARLDRPGLTGRLVDEAIARHHPAAAEAPNRALGLLDAVVDAQAELIARWMLVGFVHGVMNTDNTTLSGETIDYGPCAFLDRFDPSAVFSSIDHGGRYAYGNQPVMALWNLARLAETLLGEIDPDTDRAVTAATGVLDSFEHRYADHRRRLMATKLGLPAAAAGSVDELGDQLLDILHAAGADFTSAFRALARSLRGERADFAALVGSTATAEAWWTRWHDLAGVARDPSATADGMDRVNPVYIPRNHLLDEALTAAEAGDLDPFRRLLDVVTDPFTQRPGLERYAEPASDEFTSGFRTYCGT